MQYGICTLDLVMSIQVAPVDSWTKMKLVALGTKFENGCTNPPSLKRLDQPTNLVDLLSLQNLNSLFWTHSLSPCESSSLQAIVWTQNTTLMLHETKYYFNTAFIPLVWTPSTTLILHETAKSQIILCRQAARLVKSTCGTTCKQFTFVVSYNS